MTIVEILCLNHRSVIGLTFDANWDANPIDLCQAAHHRYFHYYGGMENSLNMSWIHPSSDVERIHKAILEVNEQLFVPKSTQVIGDYINVFKFLRDEQLHHK